MKKRYIAAVLGMMLITACAKQEPAVFPTSAGDAAGELSQPYLMVDGELYVYDDEGSNLELPEGFEEIGTVQKVDNTKLPDEEFEASRRNTGVKIYQKDSQVGILYVQTDKENPGVGRYMLDIGTSGGQVAQEQSKPADGDGLNAKTSESAQQEDIQVMAQLREMTEIIETQLPQITYGEMDARLLDFYTETMGGEYAFYGRFSDEGYSYILGKLLSGGEGELSEDAFIPGVRFIRQSYVGDYLYLSISEPPDGADNEISTGLSDVFSILTDEERGKVYLQEVESRRSQLLPPPDTSFLRVFYIEQGSQRTEYILLSDAEMEIIGNDEEIVDPEVYGRYAIRRFGSIWGLRGDNPMRDYVTKTEYELVQNRLDSEEPGAKDINGFTKATLQILNMGKVMPDGSRRLEETVTDPETLKRLEGIITESERDYLGKCGYYGVLTLYRESDGKEVTVNLAADSCGGFVYDRSYVCYSPGVEKSEEIWSCFPTVNRIYRQTAPNSGEYTADEQ